MNSKAPHLMVAAILSEDYKLAENLLKLESDPNLKCAVEKIDSFEAALQKKNYELARKIIKNYDFAKNNNTGFNAIFNHYKSLLDGYAKERHAYNGETTVDFAKKFEHFEFLSQYALKKQAVLPSNTNNFMSYFFKDLCLFDRGTREEKYYFDDEKKALVQKLIPEIAIPLIKICSKNHPQLIINNKNLDDKSNTGFLNYIMGEHYLFKLLSESFLAPLILKEMDKEQKHLLCTQIDKFITEPPFSNPEPAHLDLLKAYKGQAENILIADNIMEKVSHKNKKNPGVL